MSDARARIFGAFHGLFLVYERLTVPLEISGDVPAAPLQAKKRTRWARRVLPPVGLLLLILGANAASSWRTRTLARGKAAEAWTEYNRCVVGSPLGVGEAATRRLRRIEVNLPEPRPIGSSEAWPARCAYHLDDLNSALASGRLLSKNEALAHLDEVARAARADLAPEGTPDLADHLWSAASDAMLPLPPSPPAEVDPPAPVPAEPLTAAVLSPLPVEISVPPEEADHLPADGLRILFAGPSGESSLCSFRPDEHGAPFRTAHCADNVVPTSTDDATPGFVRSVKGRFDRFELIRPLSGADPQILSLPAGTQAIALFSDQLVWISANRHLFARTVPQETAEPGAPFDLGEILGSSPEFAACRTDTSLVVRVRSYDDTAGENRVWATVAIRTGETWGRAPKEVSIQVDAAFTCRASEATFTALDRDTVRQARCTEAGCTVSASEPFSLPWDSGRLNRVSDVDGKSILVGIGMTAGPLVAGSVTTVRMRLADVGEIARAPDVVLMGDAAHEGVDATDVHLYVRRGAALVLVTTKDREPFRAIAVAPTGKFDPLRVEKL
jgi:hypothetical protein